MTLQENKEFALRGVNHLALVCKDMARTVDFYTHTLGMPLIKTIELPDGLGQHFFFDIGKGDALAFFWFPDAPANVPGLVAPAHNVGEGPITTAQASMNHIAFDIDADEIEGYREKLLAKGVEVSEIVDHDDSPAGIAQELHDGVFVRSIYFFDPDGILLEFAGWTRPFGPDDARDTPASETDRSRYLERVRRAREAAGR